MTPIQISALPPDAQALALAYLDRTCSPAGPVNAPGPKVTGRLWCGCGEANVRKDANGVEYCGACAHVVVR